MFKRTLKQIYFFGRKILLSGLKYTILPRGNTIFDKDKVEKILAVRLDRIGDLVLSTPVFEALRKRFPLSKISVLVKKDFVCLLKDNPHISEFIGYDFFFRTLKTLKKRKFDLVIDLLMDYGLKPAILCYLTNAKCRLGFDIESRGVFFNLSVKPSKQKKHFVEHTLHLIQILGIEPNQNEPKIYLSDKIRINVLNWLRELNMSENKLLIGIHPGGYYSSQIWPEQNFSQLIDKLIEKYRAKILIFISSKEKKILKRIIAKINNKNVFGLTNLPLDKVAALIKECKLFICNNSGLLHIATAVGTPTISTMGPTVPWLWWPIGKNNIVLRKNLSCSPCNKAKCKTQECMTLITVDDVLTAVETQLEITKKWN